jgi:hypothetical protein
MREIRFAMVNKTMGPMFSGPVFPPSARETSFFASMASKRLASAITMDASSYR